MQLFTFGVSATPPRRTQAANLVGPFFSLGFISQNRMPGAGRREGGAVAVANPKSPEKALKNPVQAEEEAERRRWRGGTLQPQVRRAVSRGFGF